jgi:hypothetical protein
MAFGDAITAPAFWTEEKQTEAIMKAVIKISLVACGLILLHAAFPAPSSAQDDAKHEHHCDCDIAKHEHNCDIAKHEHHSDMISRGNDAMGFDAAKTTHHFVQNSTGGAIEVTANDPNDAESRDSIQHHLQHIAQRFKEGDFEIPMFVHDQVPPGVPVMKRLKAEISYEYAASDRGARVEIPTKNPEALAAIHDFLRFQIQEHHTGDKQ